MNLYNYVHSTDTIFLRMYQIMYFNVHIFQRIYTILHIQCTHLQRLYSILNPQYTIFQKCTKFYTFNVNNSMHTINALIFREEGE